VSKIKEEIERNKNNFDDSSYKAAAEWGAVVIDKTPIGYQSDYRYTDDGEKKHCHELGGKKLLGTSSASDVLAKPLTWWASGLAVKVLGITDPKHITLIKNKKATPEEKDAMMKSVSEMLEKIRMMTPVEYYALLDAAYRAHATSLKDSAQAGTDLHAELQRFVNDERGNFNRPAEMYHERILPFIKWARENVAKYLWSEMHCFSRSMWTGGISDLGIIDKAGKTAVLDFKSSKEAYLSQFWQCAGYGAQITENGGYTRDGIKIFEAGTKFDYYGVVPFGMEEVTPQFNYDVQGGIDAFLAELFLYKRLPKDKN
jgi:hypothetical protein